MWPQPLRPSSHPSHPPTHPTTTHPPAVSNMKNANTRESLDKIRTQVGGRAGAGPATCTCTCTYTCCGTGAEQRWGSRAHTPPSRRRHGTLAQRRERPTERCPPTCTCIHPPAPASTHLHLHPPARPSQVLENLSHMPPAPSAPLAPVPPKHEMAEAPEEEMETRGGGAALDERRVQRDDDVRA